MKEVASVTKQSSNSLISKHYLKIKIACVPTQYLALSDTFAQSDLIWGGKELAYLNFVLVDLDCYSKVTVLVRVSFFFSVHFTYQLPFPFPSLFPSLLLIQQASLPQSTPHPLIHFSESIRPPIGESTKPGT